MPNTKKSPQPVKTAPVKSTPAKSRARQPVAPYLAIGLSTVVRSIARREQIAENLDVIERASTPRCPSSASTCRSS